MTGVQTCALPISVDQAKSSMAEMGMPEWLIEGFAEYLVAYSNNYGDFFTDDVQNITGKTARSYKEFATDFAPAFG